MPVIPTIKNGSTWGSARQFEYGLGDAYRECETEHLYSYYDSYGDSVKRLPHFEPSEPKQARKNQIKCWMYDMVRRELLRRGERVDQ